MHFVEEFFPWATDLISADSFASGRETVDLVLILGFVGVEMGWASSESFHDGLSLLFLSWSSLFLFLLGPICNAFTLTNMVCIE